MCLYIRSNSTSPKPLSSHAYWHIITYFLKFISIKWLPIGEGFKSVRAHFFSYTSKVYWLLPFEFYFEILKFISNINENLENIL